MVKLPPNIKIDFNKVLRQNKINANKNQTVLLIEKQKSAVFYFKILAKLLTRLKISCIIKIQVEREKKWIKFQGIV